MKHRPDSTFVRQGRENMPEEPVYRLTLVRHGESVGNAEGRIQGHADFPLSERGRAQALALGRRWNDEAITFDRIIASPLSRALETGHIIAATLGIPAPETDPLWIEQDTGEWSGKTWDEVRRSYPDRAPADRGHLDTVSGESEPALRLRGVRALDSILQRPPARYLVISHRAILNHVLLAILGLPLHHDSEHRTHFRIRNGAFSRFRFHPSERRWQVDVIGDRSHWKDDASGNDASAHE